MYICRDAKLEDIIKIYEEKSLEPAINLKNPVLFYLFLEDKDGMEEKIGFAQIEVEDEIILREFSVEKDDPEVQLFFLKALGYKISQLGRESFLDPENFRKDFYSSPDKIKLQDLFVGSCQDV